GRCSAWRLGVARFVMREPPSPKGKQWESPGFVHGELVVHTFPGGATAIELHRMRSGCRQQWSAPYTCCPASLNPPRSPAISSTTMPDASRVATAGLVTGA